MATVSVPVVSTIVEAYLDIVCKAGDTLPLTLTFWKDSAKTIPLDFTTGTLKMQVRKKLLGDVLTEMTVGAGLAVSGAGNNILSIKKDILLVGGTYVYDMEFKLTSDSSISTILGGKFLPDQDVTNSDLEQS